MSSQPPPPDVDADPNPTETISRLLQHYLALLDEYTALRSTLNTLQTRVFQSLARANFAAERGVRRYGQDYYDERMQASRRVGISFSSTAEGGEWEEEDGVGGGPVFTFRVCPASGPKAGPSSGGDKDDREETGSEGGRGPTSIDDAKDLSGSEETKLESTEDDGRGNETKKQPLLPDDLPADDADHKQSSSSSSRKKAADPLRWFGILTPLPLRQAQGHAIQAVEDVIPRLATLSVEMGLVELEVRRARKRRAKAEKAEERKKLAELENWMDKVDVGA
ncbi:hypothetical protein N658DRAFT_491470 [Parathielavia hyrcaniae]|uniref:Vacuolar ATPase assembly protein VMA22 n=1 Tax=Parathielavia hyrcaniae TaxID=113614 RepID=A0AAN6QG85_9PEZI|nr:hypothetical protein N658DRAFT_491470 [Parathielavia hyrcaniae]